MIDLITNLPGWVSSHGVDAVLFSWLVAAVGTVGSLLVATRTMPGSDHNCDCRAC